MENQNLKKFEEVRKYQAILQHNIGKLSRVADSHKSLVRFPGISTTAVANASGGAGGGNGSGTGGGAASAAAAAAAAAAPSAP